MKFASLVIGAALAAGSTWVSAEPVSSRYTEPYPTAASKKGLQVELVEDALALGVKHAGLNFNLAQLIDPQGGTNSPGWERDGRTYRFKPGYLEAMDNRIKTLSDRGVVVTLIVLTYQSGDPEVNRILIHPQPGTLHWARGVYPHPGGAIHVSWERRDDHLVVEYEAPPGVEVISEMT